MKKLSLLLLIIVFAFAFAACGEAGEPISATLVIIDGNGEELMNITCQMTEGDTGGDLIRAACKEERMAFTEKNNMFDNFNGIASTMEDGWLMYADGEQMMVTANELTLTDGMELQIIWQNYAEYYFTE